MLARLVKASLLALFVVLVCGAAGLFFLGHPAAACLTVVLFVFAYSAVLAAEMVCLALVVDSESRPTFLSLARAWWGETLVAPRVFCWSQPFRADVEPDSLRPAGANAPAVLLVHGLFCNRGFWNPWMRRFRAQGVAFLAIDLEPVFAPIERYVDDIDSAVSRLEIASGKPPLVVAHSMGGLAVARWLCLQGNASRIQGVITIGTPHRGTWMARFGRTASARQMTIGSAWLSALAHELKVRGLAPMFTCFFGDCDNVVFPSAGACLPGADNRLIAETAHVALAFRREVFDEVQRQLALDQC